MVNARRAGGRIQILDSKILVIGQNASWAFDRDGNLIGSVSVLKAGEPDQARPNRFLPQEPASFQEGAFFLSRGHVVSSWKPGVERLERRIEFDRPVRLLRDLGETMILVDPHEGFMFSLIDENGGLIRRFGKPLIGSLRAEENASFNNFLAFYREDEILAVFQYHPIYRLYSAEGQLLDEGQYEFPAILPGPTSFPDPEVLATLEEAWDGAGPTVLKAKLEGDRLLVYFNAFQYGILDRNLRLVYQESLLENPFFAESPRWVDFDPSTRRILTVRYGSEGKLEYRWIPVQWRGSR